MSWGQAALRRHLENWVHESAFSAPLVAARHRMFIAGSLSVGALALAAFPFLVALRGPPDLFAAGALALLAVPLLLSAFVSRTGRLEEGAAISAAAFAGLVAWLGLVGDVSAPLLLACLVLAPIEAAFSGSIRALLAALVAAIASGAAIVFLAPFHVSGAAGDGTVAVIAFAYGGGIAVRLLAYMHDADDAVAGLATGNRLLADNGSDLIVRHNAEGSPIFVSPAAWALCGVPPSELRQNFLDRIHPADRPGFLAALGNALAGRPGAFPARILRAGEEGRGAFVPVEIQCRPWYEAGRRGAVTVLRDASGKVALEAELAAARAEAAEMGSVKRAFLAHMSHEFRTPLNAIIGFAELMTNETLDRLAGDSRRDYARLIHAAGVQLLTTVNELLDLAGLEAGRLILACERSSIRDLLDAAAETVRAEAAAKDLAIVRNFAADLPEIEADPRACRQIFGCLLANAVRSSQTGDRVVVDARRSGDKLVVTVRDFGMGLSEDELMQLRKSFIRSDSAYDRAPVALGLSVAAGLAELHGGGLEFWSEPGGGTIATVTLPLGPDRSDFAPRAIARPDGAAGATGMRERKRA